MYCLLQHIEENSCQEISVGRNEIPADRQQFSVEEGCWWQVCLITSKTDSAFWVSAQNG